jgi:DNA-binding NarL/FixJ family response regulator
MRVLIVEDHPIVVSGCRQLFAEYEGVLFYDASTIASGRQQLKKHAPDVIVIDVNLPDGSGLEFARELSGRCGETKIVMFSMADAPALALQAIDFGAKGFVSKSDSPTALLSAVEAVGRGETWLSDELLQKIAFMRAVPQSSPPRLTRREKNVLKLLVEGRHSSEIATELNISSKIVSTECAAIRQKLNARTTAEMVAIAVKTNIRC